MKKFQMYFLVGYTCSIFIIADSIKDAINKWHQKSPSASLGIKRIEISDVVYISPKLNKDSDLYRVELKNKDYSGEYHKYFIICYNIIEAESIALKLLASEGKYSPKERKGFFVSEVYNIGDFLK